MSFSKNASIPISASQIGYNEDLMTCIFLHLPVKSVLKCKCVCKHWQSIASNPQFCRRHASLHGLNPRPSALIFKRSFDNSSDFEFCSLSGNHRDDNNTTSRIASFDYLNAPGNANLSLLSSCNGLLLFQSLNFPDLREVYDCNPTTKKSFTLALPNYLTIALNYLTRLARVDANLAFDPCVSPHYKVVFLWRGLEDGYCIAMYSSETKIWGKVSVPLASNSVKVLKSSGVYCNGKIHWLASGFRQTSFYFDVEEGCVNVLPLPPFYHLCRPFHFFGASQGRLHMLLRDREGDTFVYDLEEDYSRWFVKYQLLGLQRENLFLGYFCDELDEGPMLLGLDDSGKIAAHNLKEKTTNKVCHLSPLFNNHDLYSRFYPVYANYEWCPVAYQWIETLSCV